MRFEHIFFFVLSFLSLKIKSVKLEISFYCLQTPCILSCGENLKKEFPSGDVGYSIGDENSEILPPGTSCELLVSLNFASAPLVLDYIKINDRFYYTQQALNLFEEKDKITEEYSSDLKKYAFFNKLCKDVCAFRFKIPPYSLRRLSSTVGLTECKDPSSRNFISIIDYGSSFNGAEQFCYSIIGCRLNFEKTKTTKSIFTDSVSHGEFFRYGTDLTQNEGYYEVLNYKYFLNNTLQCSGTITFYVSKQNCTTDTEDNLCKSCITNYSFENEEKKKCISNSDISSGYFIDKGVRYPCHPNCATCSGHFEEGKHNCTSCKEGYNYKQIFIKDGMNCFDNPCDAYGLYLDVETKECFAECRDRISYDNKTCVKKCDEPNDYVLNNRCSNKCNSEYPFVLNKVCVKSCGDYYETDNNTCVESCDKSEYFIYDENGGLEHIKRCTKSCRNQPVYKYEKDDKTCVKKCPILTDPESNKCVSECPSKYLYKEENMCTNKCSEKKIIDEFHKSCVGKCEPPLFQYNKECVIKCPKELPFYDQDRKCIESCKEKYYNEQGECLTSDKCLEYGYVVDKLCVASCPPDYSYSQQPPNNLKKCSFFLNNISEDSNKFKRLLYSKERILKSVSLYPNEYINKIQRISGGDHYMEIFSIKNTPDPSPITSKVNVTQYVEEIAKKNSVSPESIIIVKIETITQSSFPNSVSFQFFSSEGKNLTEDSTFKYNSSFPYKNKNSYQLEIWKEMKARKYDIFNREDELFVEPCLNYSIGDFDLTLNDRISYYYKDLNLCQEGCKYQSFDYEAKKTNCECGFETLPAQEFPSSSSNFQLIKCYAMFIDINMLKKNMLFITSAVQLVLLSSVAIFSFLDGIKIKAKLLNLVSTFQNPPLNSDDDNLSSKTKTEPSETLEKDSSIEKENKISKKVSVKEYEYKDEDKNDDPLLYNVYNLNNLPFSKAKKYDNRGSFEAFSYTFVNKQIFLRLFFPISKYESKSFNLSLALFSFLLLFELNTLFYSPSFISYIFRSHRKFPFERILLNAFCSLLIEIVIFKMILLSASDNFYIETAITEVKCKEDLFQILDRRLAKRRRKNTLLFIIFIVISALFLFHISIFPAMYPNNQKYLYIQCWISFALSFIFYILVSFVITLIRFLGMTLNSYSLYSFSFFFNYF